MAKASWEVYIIETESGKLYTGITTNLDRRFTAHLSSEKGARFFRFSAPRQILLREKYPNRSKATKREIAIKKMSRREKLKLIKEQRFGPEPARKYSLRENRQAKDSS